jgi:hypothetical protein
MVTITAYEPTKSYRCPCCTFKTLHGRGHFEACPVCFWEDDGQDEAELDVVRGGPNADLSLRMAKANFARFGAVELRFIGFVRKPLPEEM